MGLLSEIQMDAVDSRVSLATVLRKLKVLAVRLGNSTLGTWVDRELNGYPSGDDLPSYRVIPVNSEGDFLQGRYVLRKMPIPLYVLPEKYQRRLSTVRQTQGVAVHEALLSKADETGYFAAEWPVDIVADIQNHGPELIKYSTLVTARCILMQQDLAGMLDTIRNRVLDFALALEREDPKAGEVEQGQPHISGEKLTQLFQVTILGDNTNLALGSADFVQSVVANTLSAEELERVASIVSAVRSALPTAPLEGSDLDELRAELATIEAQLASSRPKRSVIGASLQVMNNMAQGAAGSLLAVAIQPQIAEVLRMLGLG